MTANEYLKRIDTLNILIDLKIRQTASLRRALSISAPPPNSDHVSHTRNVHIMADKIAAVVDAEREVDAMVDELVDLKNRVINWIKQLSNAKEALLLTERYIEGKSTKEMAEENNFTRRWVQQVIKDGTDHLDKILEKEHAELRQASPYIT